MTVQEIGKEIASRAGIALAWDVEGTPFTIQSIEQSGQTDCDFYMELCDAYGYAMKVYAQKIVVFDREAYKKKDPVLTIRETDIESWSFGRERPVCRGYLHQLSPGRGWGKPGVRPAPGRDPGPAFLR